MLEHRKRVFLDCSIIIRLALYRSKSATSVLPLLTNRSTGSTTDHQIFALPLTATVSWSSQQRKSFFCLESIVMMNRFMSPLLVRWYLYCLGSDAQIDHRFVRFNDGWSSESFTRPKVTDIFLTPVCPINPVVSSPHTI